MNTYTDKLREEFEREFEREFPVIEVRVPVIDEYHTGKIAYDSITEWWLSHFSLLLEDLAQSVEAEKVPSEFEQEGNHFAGYGYEYAIGYNQAISLAVERIRGVMK